MEVKAMLSTDTGSSKGIPGSRDGEATKAQSGFRKFRPVETSQSFSVRVKTSKPPLRQRRAQPQARSYREASDVWS